MKKILLSLLTFLLFFNINPAVKATEYTFDVNSSLIDSRLYLDIIVSDNIDIMAFNINVEYDKSALTPVSVTEGELLKNSSDTITSNINGKNYTADFVSAVWLDLKPINSTGTLFTIIFDINSNYIGSDTSVTIVFNEVLSGKKDLIEVQPIKKSITLPKVPSQGNTRPVLLPEIHLKNNADKIRYMNDFGDKFKPDQYATRYEIIDALYNLFDIKNASTMNFSDVDNEYETKISAFASVNVVNGYEDGTFRGNSNIKRAEFVKLLATAFNMDIVNRSTAKFIDIDNHWAKTYIETFASKGYAEGYVNNDGTYSFKPEEYVTRSEAVAFINRIIHANADKSDKTYIDLSQAHWAYDEIMKVVK